MNVAFCKPHFFTLKLNVSSYIQIITIKTHFIVTVRKSDDLELLTFHPFSHNSLTMKPPEAGVWIGKYRDNYKWHLYSPFTLFIYLSYIVPFTGVTGSQTTVCEEEGGIPDDTPPAKHKVYNDGVVSGWFGNPKYGLTGTFPLPTLTAIDNRCVSWNRSLLSSKKFTEMWQHKFVCI